MINCPLCNRSIPDSQLDKDHLIPKTFKGKELVELHRVCHRKIHATFSERELLNYYHTISKILEHNDIQSFVKWVQNKPDDFYSSSKESNTRKGKRRR